MKKNNRTFTICLKSLLLYSDQPRTRTQGEDAHQTPIYNRELFDISWMGEKKMKTGISSFVAPNTKLKEYFPIHIFTLNELFYTQIGLK